MNEVKLHFVYLHRDGSKRAIKRFRKIRPDYTKLIKQESEKIGIDVKHYLSIKRRNAPYNALAGCLLEKHAIAFPLDFYKADIQLKRYWIRHELRHCYLKKNSRIIEMMGLKFRAHDVELKEIEVKRPATIGFFYEDFDEIKCCDRLMKYYQHCGGIEDYLK